MDLITPIIDKLSLEDKSKLVGPSEVVSRLFEIIFYKHNY